MPVSIAIFRRSRRVNTDRLLPAVSESTGTALRLLIRVWRDPAPRCRGGGRADSL